MSESQSKVIARLRRQLEQEREQRAATERLLAAHDRAAAAMEAGMKERAEQAQATINRMTEAQVESYERAEKAEAALQDASVKFTHLQCERDEAQAACAAMPELAGNLYAQAQRDGCDSNAAFDVMSEGLRNAPNPGQPLLDELARLRAVVERLPKTADGVPILTGMTLYSAKETIIIGELRAHELNSCSLYDTTQWYSTRAAADAAKEKP